MSWLQGRTPQAMLGWVVSLLLVATLGHSPVPVAVSGVLIKLSLKWVFNASGVLMAIFSIILGARGELCRMRWTPLFGQN